MKRNFMLFLIIFGFAVNFAQTNQTLNPAAQEIYDRITFMENQRKEFDKGLNVRFSYAPGIVELSGISPKIVNGDYNGIYYTPTLQEIKLWKEWFEKNKHKLSYANNNDSELIYEILQRKLIQIEYEKDKFRYDICLIQIEYYREIYKEIKKHKR